MNSPNVYLILDFMFLYIILHEIYMINIDPITFFLNFLYIKDADHSSDIQYDSVSNFYVSKHGHIHLPLINCYWHKFFVVIFSSYY